MQVLPRYCVVGALRYNDERDKIADSMIYESLAGGRYMKNNEIKRYALLDELRGLDLISMILYHACWDLVSLFGVQISWYGDWQGQLWQQMICWVFILLSGFCVHLGHRTLRRGGVVFGCGALITAVTVIFMPDDRVVFGILTFLGSAMLITGLVQAGLKRIPAMAGFGASMLLFALTRNVSQHYIGFGSHVMMLPDALYANYATAFFGFYPDGFYSTDYFALLPWLFLFWAGYFLYDLASGRVMDFLRRSFCAPLGWIGRHSLLIYMLHQPVIYGVFLLVYELHIL